MVDVRSLEPIDSLAQPEDGSFVTTSTMHGCFDLCPRRFWFQYVHRFKEERKKAFTIGSVWHACIERYALSGVDGMVPTPEKAAQWTDTDPFEKGGPLWNQKPGRPVQMFPEWFASVLERDGSWVHIEDPHDITKVMDMFQATVDKQLLTHWPEDGRVVERTVMLPMVDGIVYRSFIDRGSVTEAVVEDGKTVAAPKWAVKQKALKDNMQLNAYGYWMLTERERLGLAEPETVALTHINAPKNGDAPFSRSTRVTPDHLRSKWALLVGNSEKMRDLLEAGPHSDWESIEGPKPGSGACQKYGRDGCPFQAVCTGCTPIREFLGNPDLPEAPEDMKKPTIPSKKRPKLTEKEAPSPLPRPENMPFLPWAQADCEACGGSGVDAKLDPCGECVGRAHENLQPIAGTALISDGKAQFLTKMPSNMQTEFAKHQEPGEEPMTMIGHITTTDSWNYAWPEGDLSLAEDPEPFDVSPWGFDNPSIPTAVEPNADAPSEPEPEPTPTPEPTPAPSPEPPVEEPEDKPKAKRGRKATTFTLIIGSGVTYDGLGATVNGDELINKYMAEIGGGDVASFYGLDPFRRRDALAAKAAEIAELVKGKVLHITTTHVEVSQLIGALAGIATKRVMA